MIVHAHFDFSFHFFGAYILSSRWNHFIIVFNNKLSVMTTSFNVPINAT